MPRSKDRTEKAADVLYDFVWRVGSLIVLMVLIYWGLLYYTNRAAYWRWFVYVGVGMVVIIAAFITFEVWMRKRKIQHREELIQAIKNAGQEENIKNFINRFGFEGKGVKGWTFRNHKFDWYRINDLEKDLMQKGIRLRTGKGADVYILLRRYIQEKEENLTRASIVKAPQRFALLSGPDFEKLLYRLFEAMGYNVEWIGKSGDQGGDLIANKDGERILIQAKCYRDWSTGNAAVQQVVGAMKFYDCSRTMVITTSEFTNAARDLAKATNTDLVSKGRLSEMLAQYLGEGWS